MRRRSEPYTFGQRLEAQKQRLEHEMAMLADGQQRNSMVAPLDQLQTAAEMYDFLMLRQERSASR